MRVGTVDQARLSSGARYGGSAAKTWAPGRASRQAVTWSELRHSFFAPDGVRQVLLMQQSGDLQPSHAFHARTSFSGFDCRGEVTEEEICEQTRDRNRLPVSGMRSTCMEVPARTWWPSSSRSTSSRKSSSV